MEPLDKCFYMRRLAHTDKLTRLDQQDRRESWEVIESAVRSFLEEQQGRYSLKVVRRDIRDLNKACEKASREARSALNELNEISTDR